MEEFIEMLIEMAYDHIARERRWGFYISEIKSAVQSYRRTQHDPEWMDDGAVDNAKRIASPILDIIPPVGARVAMLSQDGVPELGAVLGMIWDEKVQPLTAWIRANLAQHPGHIEIGAIKGIRIIIKTEDPAKAKDTPNQDPLPDGTIAIEADDVLLGAADATKEVALGPDVDSQFNAIVVELNKLIAYINGLAPATAAPITVPLSSVSATKVKAK